MLRSFYSLTDRCDVVHHSGTGVDLQRKNRLDCAGPVLAQAALDLGRAHRTVPVALENLDLEAESGGGFAPIQPKLTTLQNKDFVAPGQDIAQRRFPRAVPVGDVNVTAPLSREQPAEVAQQTVRQRDQRLRKNLHRGALHGLQHLVGDRGRSRYSEELAATANAHFFLLAICSLASEAQRRHVSSVKKQVDIRPVFLQPRLRSAHAVA